MFGRDPQQAVIAEETPEEVKMRPKRKCPHLWRGITFFLRRGQAPPAKRVCKEVYTTDGIPPAWPLETFFMEKDSEVFAVPAVSVEVVEAAKEDLSEYALATEAFILKAKANGKEFDPPVLLQERGGVLPRVGRQGVVGLAKQQGGSTAKQS